MTLAEQLRKETDRSSINIVLNANELRIYENIIKRCFTAARNGNYDVLIRICNVNNYRHLTIRWEKILNKLKTEKTLGFTEVKESYTEEGILDAIYINWQQATAIQDFGGYILTDDDLNIILYQGE